MKANSIFILGLIAISCVVATQTSFQMKLQEEEYKAKVEEIKTKQNMGSIILSMAELTSEQGRFKSLFTAIDNLSAFLVQDKIAENLSFSIATTQYHTDFKVLTKERKIARKLYTSDDAQLNSHLYPIRKSLVKIISSQESELKTLQSDLVALKANRDAQVKQYKARSTDFNGAIESCKQALPLLKGLENGQSFAELDADVFAQISIQMKGSLAKLDMGQLYTIFVDSLIQNLKAKNYVNQEGLKAVIHQIQMLQERLEKGLVALENDEVANKVKFEQTELGLNKAIKTIQNQLVQNKLKLHETKATIAIIEKHRDEQKAVYKEKVMNLGIINNQYKQRTADHNIYLKQIDTEEQTIADAVRILNKGGVTRKD